MKVLKDVLENYLDLKETTKISSRPTRVEQKAIKQTIPKFFSAVLRKNGYEHLFTVKGSYGEGNLANIPWVAIFHNSITKSARHGYYVVLLFSETMSSCYLSLNQGVLNYIDNYGQKNAMQKMQKVANQVLSYFCPAEDSIVGKINLNSTGSLGKGYEFGNIEAFYYEKLNLPTADKFEKDLRILLDHYMLLINKVGRDIQNLFIENENNYQQNCLEQAGIFAGTDQLQCLKEPNEATYIVTKKFRDPKMAAQALCNANFECEINAAHVTFFSKINNKPYVEAHHLVPFSQQKQFDNSLDILPNIVALCPMCHRLLHHGVWEDKKVLLKFLLTKRAESLKSCKIFVTLEDLKQFYKHGDLLED